MSRMLPLAVIIIVLQTATAQPQFEERSRQAGLQFVHNGMLLMGGGAAAFDVDNDGDEDLYVTGGTEHDALFLNDGAGNFTNVSEQFGIVELTKNVVTTSVTTGDIDNDGLREIFVGTIGPVNTEGVWSKNLLLQFNAELNQFEDHAMDFGLKDKSFCMGGHFFDVNLDGFLDLYVLNYVEEPGVITEGSQVVGFDHHCGRNPLYINNGKQFFSDRSVIYGLINDGCTLAATSSDIDLDGDPDLLVANDFGRWVLPNALYQNDYPAPSFADISEASGMDAEMYGMGIAVGDYDEDLDPDFYITNIAANRFFENQGNKTFADLAPYLGLEDAYALGTALYTTGWGTFFADVNNDTYLDLFIANGFVASAIDRDGYRQEDHLLLGGQNHQFENVGAESGITFEGLSRGAVYADFNRDGKIDLLTVTNDILFPGPTNFLQYYENRSPDRNWIAFRLEGNLSNRDAFGAKVVLHHGWRKRIQEVSGGSSHASQHSSVVHFGLADLDQVDSVQVFWPGGNMETTYTPAINQVHRIVQRESAEERVSTEGIFLQQDMKIRFNPASQRVELDYQGYQFYECTLVVSDMIGRVIKRQELFFLPNQSQKVALSNFDTPILVVCIRGKDTVSAKKFVQVK